ncbi:MAG: sulfotransferase [Candidatus Aminicenantes bacterium]
MKKIFFHVGLAKTGTTYLQHKFFPKLKGIQYIQRTKYRDFKYVQIIKKTDYDKYLISNEFDRQLRKEVNNIASVYPHAKIIMVLRRHDSWIASQYKRRIKNGYSFYFKEFIDLENDQGFWKQKDLYFYPMIKMIENKFKSRPLVLFYRDLRNDPYLFLEKIAKFLEATFDKESVDLSPKHRSFNEKQLKIIRKFSRFLFSQNFEYSDKYWVSKIQRLYRMIPRYFILFISLLVPDFLVEESPLIPKKELEKVRKHYEDDWNKCLEYALKSKS